MRLLQTYVIIHGFTNYQGVGSFAGFRPASEGAGARTGGWGKHTMGFRYSPLSPPKIPLLFLQKIFGLYLYSRTEVSGTAHPLYAAVAAARENSEISDMGRVMVSLYEFARTHFIQNTTP
jgi:hypothetical protein